MNQEPAIGSAHADPCLDFMIRHDMELSAEVYLAYAFPEGVPEYVDIRQHLPAELLETISTAPTEAE